jgi:hypothetical protein
MMQDALLIFIRNPVRGKVKSRIARTAGEEVALRIYLALLGHTRAVCTQVDAARLLFYSDHIGHGDEWPADIFQKFLQQGEGLGERMLQAFQTALAEYRRAVIIGSDCPAITPALIHQAFDLLGTHQLVIGPSADGGYYLLGMHSPHSILFEHIAWGTEAVFTQTMERAAEIGLKAAMLPTLPDIDYEEDWERHGWAL